MIPTVPPEQQELARLEAKQQSLIDDIVASELKLETFKTELAQFRQRYHSIVGRLYAELDELDAQIAAEELADKPDNEALVIEAQQSRERAQASAEEAGIIERAPPSPPEITPDLKRAYRKAAALMHPDRATVDTERERRHNFMSRLNQAYELGDQAAVEALMAEFGSDPEAVTGTDIGSRIVKALRRIAQCSARLQALSIELAEMESGEWAVLRKSVLEAEAYGDNPLGNLARELQKEIDEKTSRLNQGVLPYYR